QTLVFCRTRSPEFSVSLLPRAFVKNHPGSAEPVSEHRKAKGVKGLLHGHEDLPAIGEQGINAFRLFSAVDCEGKIDALHGLETVRRNIGSHKLRLSDPQAGMDNRVSLIGRNFLPVGQLVAGHHHDDFSAEMVFIESERLVAVSAIVEKGVQFHEVAFPFGMCSRWDVKKSDSVLAR